MKKRPLFILVISVLIVALCAGGAAAKINHDKKNYEEKLNTLEKENTSLKKELNELKNKNASDISAETTYNQAMKILSDIYLLIEDGQTQKAKDELEKFDTSTFDDTIVNFKKALIKATE